MSAARSKRPVTTRSVSRDPLRTIAAYTGIFRAKDFILGPAEPIFKLTLFLLENGEVPEQVYGQRNDDQYQKTQGFARSKRQISANIPKSKLIGSSNKKLDPAKQLHEAGYPFSHIGTELMNLDGKFEVVSNEVLLLKDAIQDEAKALSRKVDDSQAAALEKVEHLFDRKFVGISLMGLGCISLMFAAVTFLRERGFTGTALGWVALIPGLGLPAFAYMLTHRLRR